MRIHTQLNDLHSPEIVKQISSISSELKVKVDVTIAEAYVNIFLNIDNQLLNKKTYFFHDHKSNPSKPKPKSSEETPG